MDIREIMQIAVESVGGSHNYMWVEKKRWPDYVWARYVAMQIAKENGFCAYAISLELGMDNTTVRYGLDQYKARVHKAGQVEVAIERRIRRRINAKRCTDEVDVNRAAMIKEERNQEIRRLRRIGWTLGGLAKRYEMEVSEIGLLVDR